MSVLALPVRTVKFKADQVCMTQGVSAWSKESEFDLSTLLVRHYCGDWGDVCSEDAARNNEALVDGDGNLHSAFNLHGLNVRIWVITEWDRSLTTILFPHEY